MRIARMLPVAVLLAIAACTDGQVEIRGENEPSAVTAVLMNVVPTTSVSSPASQPRETATARAAPTASLSSQPSPLHTSTAAFIASPTLTVEPAVTAVAPTPVPAAPPLAGIAVEKVADDFDQPVQLTHAGDGSGRLFVVGRRGTIQFLDQDSIQPRVFLDIGNLVSTGGSEQGLLGLAFHPGYIDNGRLFVNYTDTDGDTVVAEYRVSPEDSDRADPAAVEIVLTYDQPFRNHNGGMLAFGPDGYLYIGTGDGGSGGDPQGNGQDLSSLLGKMLRIDVNRGAPYAIPADNPFAGDASVQPEIWAYGLRNPWRYSFDREIGDLYIADVGQNRIEEANFQAVGSRGGENYGWNVTEGSRCFQPTADCDKSGFALPIAEYEHDEGCSITGGYVYRGESESALLGHYIFADYCSGRIWTSVRSPDGGWTTTERLRTGLSISSFGEDESGEVYFVDFAGGAVFRILAVAG